MELYGRVPAAPDPDTGLEESMWRMGLGSGGGGGGGGAPFPERPGEQDCPYYMRTGTCGYGERCRYNHPCDRGALTGVMEYPERVGQPVCEYYVRSGNCKFGSTCKFHHPRQEGGSAQPVAFNYCGYPLRLGEKECAYYMKTGQCKFGLTCRFHHPQPGGDSVPSTAPAFFTTVQHPSAPSPHQYQSYPSWQAARPPVLPGSYMPGSYAPMLLSPGVVPVQGWNPYLTPANSIASPDGQQTVQEGHIFGSPNQAVSTNPALPRIPSPAGPSSTSQRENKFPERPGQPECQFYMKTGDCKFGAMCKFHHPPDWSRQRMNVVLNALGLPLRPGAQPCSYYIQHGLCKFGQTCKFDHPITTMSYNPASSLSDSVGDPYPIRFSVATSVPSSSSSELQPEFVSNKEPFSSRMPSENSSRSSIGSIFPNRGFLPHSFIRPQISTSSSSSSPPDLASEISSSR